MQNPDTDKIVDGAAKFYDDNYELLDAALPLNQMF